MNNWNQVNEDWQKSFFTWHLRVVLRSRTWKQRPRAPWGCAPGAGVVDMAMHSMGVRRTFSGRRRNCQLPPAAPNPPQSAFSIWSCNTHNTESVLLQMHYISNRGAQTKQPFTNIFIHLNIMVCHATHMRQNMQMRLLICAVWIMRSKISHINHTHAVCFQVLGQINLNRHYMVRCMRTTAWFA